jgi:hypothetical protein
LADNRNSSWVTRDELNYLKHIGEHQPEYSRPRTSKRYKLELLRRYIDAASRRVRWGDIMSKVAIGFAKSEIERLERT